MTAKIISFTDYYDTRRLSLWQLQRISYSYQSYLSKHKRDEVVKARLRIVLYELNRRKELKNARQQSKRV